MSGCLEPSRCWLCGRFVKKRKAVPHRKCDRCQVAWVQPYANQSTWQVKANPAALEQGLGQAWYFRPGAYYADAFDRLIDHAKLYIPSPA